MPSPARAPRTTLLVPAYGHPLLEPGMWKRLVESAPLVRAVVVNPASGPGQAVDPAYPPVLQRLRAAGVRLIGYVDTAYARRSVAQIEADLAAHRDLYEITDVFFDQVSAGSPELDHYADVVLRARVGGARFVALNPGVPPDPGYLDLADLVVTFEGTWRDYQETFGRAPSGTGRGGYDAPSGTGSGGYGGVPEWSWTAPAGRLCHLVHAMPQGPGAREACAELIDLALAVNVATVFASDGSGANPWDRLSQTLLDEVSRREAGVR